MRIIFSERVRQQRAELLCAALISQSNPAKVLDVLPDTLHEFGDIVNETLEPIVKKARLEIDRAVKSTSVKIKMWALEHLAIAKKLGRRTDLFEKLINDPIGSTSKIAHRMLSVQTAHPSALTKSGPKSVDDVLYGIGTL